MNNEQRGKDFAKASAQFDGIYAQVAFSTGCEHGYQYAVDKACEYIGNYLGMALSCYPIDIDVLIKDKFVSKFVDSICKAMED